MALELPSCNGDEDEKNKVVMKFLAKHFPDAVTEKTLGGLHVAYELKPGNEELYADAREFLFNTKPIERDPPEEEEEPCYKNGGGSGSGAVSVCE
jgi:hypothetical protein